MNACPTNTTGPVERGPSGVLGSMNTTGPVERGPRGLLWWSVERPARIT
jgi:hypothetical protein